MNELGVYCTTVSSDSVRGIAESIGISDLSTEAAKELADDVSYRLKLIIQDAAKFMHHGKRQKLTVADVDQALKVKNIEPQYGFATREFIPFRFSSGGGRELNFLDEKEQDITELLSSAMPKLPPEVHLRAHWLCIEGVQPTIPENPPPISKEAQKLESIDPVSKFSKLAKERESAGKPTTGKVHRLQKVGTVHVKQLATHELSVEQQLYYKEITEACVGSDEIRRAEALQSLASDPGLHEMLPRMCTFIAEGVKVNVVQSNLALLIYLMRMVKALLDNQSLCLEKYLHELLPAVATCVVSKQLCARPEADNHWALRDFASRLMLQVCRNFNTSTNNVQTRVTRMFCRTLHDERVPLASLYGSLQGLCELGTEVVKVFILPSLKYISKRIEESTDGLVYSNVDRIAAGHIRILMTKALSPLLKTLRQPPDYLEDYVSEYGSLGSHLHAAVVKSRSQSLPASAGPPRPAGHPSLAQSGAVQQAGILKPLSACHPLDLEHQTSDVSFISNGGPSQVRTIMMGSPMTSRTVVTPSNPSKYVIVSSRPPTPNQGSNLGMKPVFVAQPQPLKMEHEEVILDD